MPSKKIDLLDNAWQELKRKYVEEWEPTEQDIDWLTTTINSLKVGGKWTIPAAGVTFEKVGHDHLRLEGIITDDIINAFVAIEKTKKVGERAAIKVDTEKAADYVLFHP
jgi:hypothetical protein